MPAAAPVECGQRPALGGTTSTGRVEVMNDGDTHAWPRTDVPQELGRRRQAACKGHAPTSKQAVAARRGQNRGKGAFPLPAIGKWFALPRLGIML